MIKIEFNDNSNMKELLSTNYDTYKNILNEIYEKLCVAINELEEDKYKKIYSIKYVESCAFKNIAEQKIKIMLNNTQFGRTYSTLLNTDKETYINDNLSFLYKLNDFNLNVDCMAAYTLNELQNFCKEYTLGNTR